MIVAAACLAWACTAVRAPATSRRPPSRLAAVAGGVVGAALLPPPQTFPPARSLYHRPARVQKAPWRNNGDACIYYHFFDAYNSASILLLASFSCSTTDVYVECNIWQYLALSQSYKW